MPDALVAGGLSVLLERSDELGTLSHEWLGVGQAAGVEQGGRGLGSEREVRDAVCRDEPSSAGSPSQPDQVRGAPALERGSMAPRRMRRYATRRTEASGSRVSGGSLQG